MDKISPKGLISILAILLSAAVMAAGWEMNPISWTLDDASRTIRADGSASFALADEPCSEDVFVEAELRPEGAGTNGWATLGVAIHDDDRNFWHVALVRSPPDVGAERHSFELCEMRGGVWLSQNIDALFFEEPQFLCHDDANGLHIFSQHTHPEGLHFPGCR